MNKKFIAVTAGLAAVAGLIALFARKNMGRKTEKPAPEEKSETPAEPYTAKDVNAEITANESGEMDHNAESAENVLSLEQTDSLEEQPVPEPMKSNVQPSRRVGQYDDDMNLIAEFESATAAAKAVGSNRTSIRNAANGKQRHAAGFVWRYLD